MLPKLLFCVRSAAVVATRRALLRTIGPSPTRRVRYSSRTAFAAFFVRKKRGEMSSVNARDILRRWWRWASRVNLRSFLPSYGSICFLFWHWLAMPRLGDLCCYLQHHVYVSHSPSISEWLHAQSSPQAHASQAPQGLGRIWR